MKLSFLLIFVFLVGKISFACDIKSVKKSKNELDIWLGNNSEFSKAYKNGKCALDKVLNDIPLKEKLIIARLIAKSYILEKKKEQEFLTYNY